MSDCLTAADRALLRALSRGGPHMVSDLAGKLGVSESAVRARAWRLYRFVESDRAHGYASYSRTDDGRRAHRGQAVKL